MKTHACVIDAMQACGIDALELSVAHVQYNQPASVQSALASYSKGGITLTSYITSCTDDEKSLRALFAFASQAGFHTLGVMPTPDALPLLDRMTEEYGINAAIHNHGRKAVFGTFRELDWAFQCTSSRIGLCLDTAWALDAGEDPCVMVERYRDRLYGVHLKDFVFDTAGHPQDVIIGTGNLNVIAFLRTLRSISFRGYLSLEYESNAENPLPSIKQCLARLYDILI